MVSPPKPPRAHDWKLLLKNIRVTLGQEENAAGQIFLLSSSSLYTGSDQLCVELLEVVTIVSSYGLFTYQQYSDKIN